MTDATPLTSEQITQEDREAAAKLAQWLTDAQNEWEGMVPWFSTGAPDAFRKGAFDGHDYIQAFARHRIAALSASPAPVGWRLVPIELTQEMRKAGETEMMARHTNLDCFNDPYVDSTWGAMLAASPAPSGQGVSGEVAKPVGLREAVARYASEDGWASDWQHALGIADEVLQMVHSYQTHPLAAPAPSCAPGEVERLMAEVQKWRHKLWMVACHAIGGGMPNIEGIEQSTNDICVQISALRNKVYQAGKAAALSPQGLDAKEGGLAKSAAKHAAICANLADQTPVAGEPDPLWWERQSALREAAVLLRNLSTPSQRLDAATVERCAQVFREGVVEQSQRLGVPPGEGEAPGNWRDRVRREAIRTLATDPHQHGGKGA